ncbi:MAG TPA: phenylalanine--tRNA ligase subunit beta [Patescibacteria group bacterium]|nr:phenylalanine--tRNA ligase subunit beta [Patescibacteria group bacterium]
MNLAGVSDSQLAQALTFAGNKVASVTKKDGDTVFEFEVTSNRPDTLSIIGLAREAAAILNQNLKLPKETEINFPDNPALTLNNDKKLCPTYALVGFSGVTVKPSSKLIQTRLSLSGFRPVNNIVDITNYLMLATCQPMHAFDADKIEGELTLRVAKAGETITSLDHVERILEGGEIIIADEKKIIDLAGLMGGLNSEVSDQTKNVLLLVPIYDSVTIRRAGKNLKLRTEASNRFEKKLDLTQVEAVAKMAAALIAAEANGTPSTKLVNLTPEYVAPIIKLTPEKVKKVIGIDIEIDLNVLEIKVDGDHYQPPAWRRDLETDVDLIEEIARLYGYNQLPKTLPSGTIPVHPTALKPNWMRKIRDLAAQLGYTEGYSSTLINQREGNHLKVLHPMSSDFEYMRTTILESLLPATPGNWFELGTVFNPNPKSDKLPIEIQELGMTSTKFNYAQIKGQIETLGERLGVSLMIDKDSQIILDNKSIGSVTKVDHAWLTIINASVLAEKATGQFQLPSVSTFQAIVEDLTVTLPEKTFIGPVIEAIKAANRLVAGVELTKIYKQNFTFHLIYQSLTRQLSARDVQPVRRLIVGTVSRKFKAKLVGKL